MTPGLNVVYGLNGAGKSRLLRGITHALCGIESDINVALVVQLHAGSPSQTSTRNDESSVRVAAFGREPADAIAAACASASDFQWEMREFAAPVDQRIVKSEAVQRLIDDLMWRRLGTATPLSREIAEDALFLFSPTGTSSSPSWDVWPVADTRRPLAKSECAALEALAESAYDSVEHESDEDPTELLEEASAESPLFAPSSNEVWSSGSARHLLQPSPFMPYSFGGHFADQVEPVRVRGRVDFGVDLISTDLEITAATRDHLAVLHAALSSALYGDPDTPVASALRRTGPRVFSPAFRAQATSPTEPAPDWSVLMDPTIDDDDEIERFVERRSAEIRSSLDAFITDLEDRVNRELKSVLLDAPSAKLRLPRSERPFTPDPVLWTFGPRNLRVEALSRAEQQWATRTINEAIARQVRELVLGETHHRALLYVVDEPESALHRAAEAHMAATLRKRANSGTVMLVSTHSPELLDAPEGNITEVKKNAAKYGRSLIQRLDVSDRRALDQLGLVPSDLLRWPRVILLVEGEHDAVLLEAFLGQRLRQARVKVVPLHGGAKLAQTVDSRVLFDHTDAHVVALLDNLRAERLSDVWRRATELAVRGDVDSAKTVVIEGLPNDPKKKGDEANYMRTWLTRAVEAGLASRATPFALGEVDVIRYLPVSYFVPGVDSWASLDEEHHLARSDPSRKSPVPADFKKWLEQRYRVSITPAVLQEAAAMTDPPRDFDLLMKTLEALSSEVR